MLQNRKRGASDVIFSGVSSMASKRAGCKINALNDEVLKQKCASGLQKVQGKIFLLLDTRQQSWPLLLCYVLMRQRFKEYLGPLTLFWRSSLPAKIRLRSLSSVLDNPLSAILFLSHTVPCFSWFHPFLKVIVLVLEV